MTTAEEFRCDVDPDFFRDEECDYEKSDLRDSCPKHERNWNALTRRYVAEEIHNVPVHNTAEMPLTEFTFDFPRRQISTEFHGYNAVALCEKWSFDSASIAMLWSNACASDFERALILTMPNGGAETFELARDQYEMLRHHTKNCSCEDKENHDGLCGVPCVEVHGFPPRCRNCGDRHCPDHAEECEDETGW